MARVTIHSFTQPWLLPRALIFARYRSLCAITHSNSGKEWANVSLHFPPNRVCHCIENGAYIRCTYIQHLEEGTEHGAPNQADPGQSRQGRADDQWRLPKEGSRATTCLLQALSLDQPPRPAPHFLSENLTKTTSDNREQPRDPACHYTHTDRDTDTNTYTDTHTGRKQYNT